MNLKDPRGRGLVLDLAQRFDVVAENSRAGAMTRLGLGYADVAAVHPAGIYVSVSGFGNSVPTPYRDWPAYAPIVEAMSGIYEMKRLGDEPPTVAPVGALGDISAALFATIGILAALRQRESTGRGQYVDIAMFDAVLAMTDIEEWASGLTKIEAARAMSAVPPRPAGRRPPWLGEHTSAVLAAELGLSAGQITVLREAGSSAELAPDMTTPPGACAREGVPWPVRASPHGERRNMAPAGRYSMKAVI